MDRPRSVYPSCVVECLVILPSGSCDAPVPRLKQVFELSLGVGVQKAGALLLTPPMGSFPPRFPPRPQHEPVGEAEWSRGQPTHVSQVYYLGEGETSRQWLQQEPNSKAELCLSHGGGPATCGFSVPHHNALMWDDMLRDIPSRTSSQVKGRGPAGGCGVVGG